MLYQSIPEELVLQVSALKTVKEIWEALKTRTKEDEYPQGSGRGRGRSNSRGRGRGRSSGGRGRGQERGQTSYHQRKQIDKTKIKCFRCDTMGHYASECPTRHAMEESNLAHTPDEGLALMMTIGEEIRNHRVLLNEEQVIPRRYDTAEIGYWFLDNGASNHMARHQDFFSDLDRNIKGKVRFGDGSNVEIEGKGDIILQCKTGDQKVLTGVYFIPTLRSNIISLGQLTEAGYEVTMKHDLLWIKEEDGALLMKVLRTQDRRYKIELKVVPPVCLHANFDALAWLWHARLGHRNFHSMKLLTTKNLAKGMPTISHPSQVCDSCTTGKQTRSPFPRHSEYRAKEALELIYADVCGPISPVTPGGNKYILLIVDDRSRYMWEYLIKERIELEAKRKIKILRTDNRGGLCLISSKTYQRGWHPASIHGSLLSSAKQSGREKE
ncbi:hypothetical protein E3N88_26260 [Mikania micrantha]|uniref:CCHC-type domain-containing protein n=1 Tax=Mikania micrantha TaxID=192012 RepID=A0A5N6N9S3_9ASTR|nr:hypothetical protein E3N88_26260 [Mikania micrantha]